MYKYAFILLAVTIPVLSPSLRACDDDNDNGDLKIVHFKDGLTPNGPVDTESRRGDTEGYSTDFVYRDYGPARVAPPVEQPVSRPTS
jgi:hypothetical protein